MFAQDKGSFDPAKGPLFNKDAFEPVSAFNYYYGRGNRVEESIRGFAYQNQDLTLMKNTDGGRHQPAAALRGVQHVELAHVPGWRRIW